MIFAWEAFEGKVAPFLMVEDTSDTMSSWMIPPKSGEKHGTYRSVLSITLINTTGKQH